MSSNTTVTSRTSRRSRKRQTVKKASIFQRISGLRSFRRGANLIKFLRTATFFAALPLVLLFASASTDYYVALEGYSSIEYLTFDNLPTRIEPNPAGRVRAEVIKSQVQSYVYLFVLFLALLHFRKVIRFFLSMPVLIIITMYLATTAFQSVDPDRVISNSILTFINILAAAIFAISQQGRENRLRNFYLVVFIPFVVHQLASLVLYFSIGLDILGFIASGENRVGGFSGNPNSLSLQALIGIWAAMSLLFVRNASRILKFFSLLSLGLFSINVLMSGSGTGLLVGTAIVLLMLWLNFVSYFSAMTRMAINMLLISTAFFSIAAVVFFVTPAEIFLAATSAVGKEATLTGRTDFWEVARAAIAEKFWFGWGFDNHESVLSTPAYSIPLKHYHNGFLDNAVAGGMVLIALIVVCFVIFISRLLKEWRFDYKVYPLGVAFVLLILLNLSEYSLLRPNSQPWLLFLCALSYVVANHARIGVLPEALWVDPRAFRSKTMGIEDMKSSRPTRRRRKRRASSVGGGNKSY